MKAKLIASVVAAPLAFLSSLAFAAEPVSLSEHQMDSITAGQICVTCNPDEGGAIKSITITQENITILRGGNAKPIVVSFRLR